MSRRGSTPCRNFITEIDGLDIHFIHVRSKHENALPMIVTHGWPGSIIEQLKIIEPLTNPTAHGGSAADAFHLVIPSLPGYGFSGKPTAPGWNPVSIAKAWATLMQRLGYTQYVAQGGDWGNAVSELMALQQPPGLLGIHTNMAATVPADVSKALAVGGPPPAGLSPDEKHAWDQLDDFYKNGLGYALEMSNRPQTLYGIADSPVGLAAWMIDHDIRSYQMIARVFDGKPEGLTRDDILDNITLYWLTNTAISSARLYWDNRHNLPAGGFFDLRGVKIPVAVSAFPTRSTRRRGAGRRGVSQAHPLQQARQGRAFRGLGAAGALRRRDARCVQIAALIDPKTSAPARCARRLPCKRQHRSESEGIHQLRDSSWITCPNPAGAPSSPLRQPPAPSAVLPRQPRAPPHPRGRARRKKTARSVPSASTFRRRQLVDLRRRIAATQWPERETVADQSQGVQLATMQELARYWATDYDWRKCEAKLNALPQFITEIDGLDIHFIHVRSKHENALPLIVTHGWPGSIIEQLKIIDPLDQSHGTWRRAHRTLSMS